MVSENSYGDPVKREIIRVEPLSTYLERWKAPTSAVTRCGDTIYVSGFPPFDPETGTVIAMPLERQTELVLEQMKLCVETAGSSLELVLKCNVYCTSVENSPWSTPFTRVTFPGILRHASLSVFPRGRVHLT
jgi:enamine deaminase RidA (YjgF/YER057c/UK114 family)